MRSFSRIVLFCFAPLLILAACDDPFLGNPDPVIVTGTFTLAAPSPAQSATPSALDVTSVGGFVRGGRFPERVQDANAGWDIAVRVRDGRLSLVPSAAFGFGGRAGLTPAIPGQTFEGLAELPSGVRFEIENPIVAEPGGLHVVRSREFSTGFGGCVQYAKIQVLEVDLEEGTMRVQVATNEQCFDTRLVEAGS